MAQTAGRRAASRAKRWSASEVAKHAVEHAALQQLYATLLEEASREVTDADVASSDSD